MKSTVLAVAVATTIMIFAQSAYARDHHHRQYQHNGHHYRLVASRGMRAEPQWAWPASSASGWTSQATTRLFASAGSARFEQSSARSRRRGGGRPAAWCGWEMRRLVGADPGPSFNLARNWTRWGRAGAAGIGAVVVWPHHVGKIVGKENGEWIIESGNDGHALRTRPRSIAGAIAIRWG
ncbi:MAG TPA: hypothetical protein VGV62_16710 [Xanthobacteraceae bacterium]|jgi:hypothetical protein|nr:hypothetical protein [Xanthobacteraceae bacterium]